MSRENHPFYAKHSPILKAIWSINRQSKDVNEKLSTLKEAIKTNSPANLVEMYDEKTGEARAKVSPLIIACFEGDYDTIHFLIENGADPNQTESEHDLTAIHILVDGPYKGQTFDEKQRAQLIREMVKKGADVNKPDKHQLAPIHKAVINDHSACIDALIEANVDPNVVFLGERAISIAARQNRDVILNKLVNYSKTNINVTNDNGGTILHFAAAAMVDTPECVDLLIKAGLNVNAQDQRGNTPTLVACFFNKPRILQSLIHAKADLTIKNKEGKDAAAICQERDCDECKALLSA